MNLLFNLLILLLGGANYVTSEIYPDKSKPPVETIKTEVEAWKTSPMDNVLFEKQNTSLNFANTANGNPTITVDTTSTFQTIDGFGNCLTGGSATLLNHMDKASRVLILKELFATNANNIGISYLRVSIGASDLSDHPFTYDDLPAGQTYVNMDKFQP